MAFLARDDQCGGATARRRPHARAALDQQPHGVGLPVPSGASQQREVVLGLELRVELGRERRAARPPGEEGAQRAEVALAQLGGHDGADGATLWDSEDKWEGALQVSGDTPLAGSGGPSPVSRHTSRLPWVWL